MYRNVQQQQQQQQQAGTAARKLQDLLRCPRLSLLLRQPPPAHPTETQGQLIAACITALQQLGQTLHSLPDSATAHQQLGAALRHEELTVQQGW
jgi:hypothetical protein